VKREAIRAERDRIAPELHDVIAHLVSAMVVQTAAAQDLVQTDPERADGCCHWFADIRRSPPRSTPTGSQNGPRSKVRLAVRAPIAIRHDRTRITPSRRTTASGIPPFDEFRAR
jgi:hypothetical protein